VMQQTCVSFYFHLRTIRIRIRLNSANPVFIWVILFETEGKEAMWTSASKGYTWRAPWKNRISSTTMKVRKSLVKPATRQNISSCSVLPLEIVMHDAFNVILWTSADVCVVHDDLGWKNRTTRCNRFWRAGCSQLEYIHSFSILTE